MSSSLFWWSPFPFLRLLPPLAAGILVQWYANAPYRVSAALLLLSLFLLCAYPFLSLHLRFRLKVAAGIILHLLLFSLGALRTHFRDVRTEPAGLYRQYRPGDLCRVVLRETPLDRPRSLKAEATVTALVRGDSLLPVSGSVLLYFKKGAPLPPLRYGTVLLLAAPLQPIRGSGNPGAFDYGQYCLFNGLLHQAFLPPADFGILPGAEKGWTRLVISSREALIRLIRAHVQGRREQGLAEALLIGYRHDLDKDLVQAYSDTGVVHVIAISGLHLGVIYGLLLLLTRPLGKRKALRFLRLVLLLGGLWAFTLLTGAGPSILRSAVMFSCLALGNTLGRKSGTFNALFLSAFLLLCHNPFWLWDAGFQLSYAAVGSILLFSRPLSCLVYFPNKLLDWIWQLQAVTVAAQLLTLPVLLYHFHQFPLLFLLTNLVAVPLSSLILLALLLLCALFFLPSVAAWLGGLLHHLIAGMNTYIERLGSVSFAVWDGFSLSPVQAVLLLAAIGAAGIGLVERKRSALYPVLLLLLLFTALRSLSFYEKGRQQKIILYNISRHPAMECISGRKAVFIGDSAVMQDKALYDFHLRPSRILHRTVSLAAPRSPKAFLFGTKRVLILDTAVIVSNPAQPLRIDLLVLSRKPSLHIRKLASALFIRQVVLDASVPSRKARAWQKECDSLGLPCHDAAQKGAFVMSVQ